MDDLDDLLDELSKQSRSKMLWEEWQRQLVERGEMLPPEVVAGNLYPKPYAFICHSGGGYSIHSVPSIRPLLQYRYRTIMVWLN